MEHGEVEVIVAHGGNVAKLHPAVLNSVQRVKAVIYWGPAKDADLEVWEVWGWSFRKRGCEF